MYKLLTTIVTLSILVTACVPGAKQLNQNTNTNTNVNRVTDEIDTSDWKTYRNEEYGFEFRYPEDWTYGLDGLGNINLQDDGEHYIEGSLVYPITISIAEVENDFSFNDWVADLTNIKNDREGWVREVAFCCGSLAVESFDYLGKKTTIYKDGILYRIGVNNLGVLSVNQVTDGVYGGVVSSWDFSSVNTDKFDQDADKSQIIKNFLIDQVELELSDLFKDELDSGGYWELGNTDGVFATGLAGFSEGGGYWWLAKKKYNSWLMVFKGQEYPACSFLHENSVPLGIYIDLCFDKDGKAIQYISTVQDQINISDWKTYLDNERNIQFKYPNNWKEESSSGKVEFWLSKANREEGEPFPLLILEYGQLNQENFTEFIEKHLVKNGNEIGFNAAFIENSNLRNKEYEQKIVSLNNQHDVYVYYFKNSNGAVYIFSSQLDFRKNLTIYSILESFTF